MKVLLSLLGGALLSASSVSLAANRWATVTSPTPTVNGIESIGDYTAGCLRGALTLPENGEGYQVMRLSRQRYFGHPDLIQFIEKLGRSAVDKDWGTLLIGDLGQARGGPTPSGHRSHQSGLDVDIWFLLSREASKRKLSHGEREKWGAPSVLLPHSDTINPSQWSPAMEQVLETAALMPEVDRIFVNAAIKRELCNKNGPEARPWLKKIRPWWAHDDHFHVRLKCPIDSPNCKAQDPVPNSNGCDASLDWWFSAEAKTPSTVPKKAPAPLRLPEQCNAVLTE
ncbi:MAG: penicillin-insensitive murein endopeptidase [Methylicorpusculum sp.]|uniref:penicillin-insensitive murein endopeptidase n=1 Tax=Methylicorpusculum sp. TaxID=2713644 RepID=UPI002719BBF9|nr:penicillin-insensitive murein endopeptidase [Methylicorpusculum sp.]MDO8937762.1 penicillin-insensitive murein endopeptidase [Methylicorpusculum sp.]MDP2200560.1 penicillin-insensitive murein endopeptidase [Methylicorpusculum sp.]